MEHQIPETLLSTDKLEKQLQEQSHELYQQKNSNRWVHLISEWQELSHKDLKSGHRQQLGVRLRLVAGHGPL